TFNLDHHRGNPQFGNYNYVDVDAAATAEIIYELLVALQVPVTPDIAQALFAGIVMDTGNFLNGNTTAKSLRIAADLIDSGVNIDHSRINLFESKPRAEVALMARALDNLEISSDGTMAWISLSYEEVAEAGALELYPETLINYTRMIDGVEVGMLFREIRPGTVKVGFRSKGKVDVASLASQFGGGGHLQAAGARQNGSLSEVIGRVLEVVKDVMA
ncbi:MAG: DHH family phosphoesterase, partial [Deltaproteobacteria bacterium]